MLFEDLVLEYWESDLGKISRRVMKIKTKAIPKVMIAVIGISIFVLIVSADVRSHRPDLKYPTRPDPDLFPSAEYERAIEDYNKVIELNPNYTKAYYDRGMAYYHLKQYERALEDYSKVIELNPNDIVTYYNRGYVYGLLGQYERALEDYSKVIELKSSDRYYDIYYDRGMAYYHLKQYERAIEDYNKAIELNPRMSAGYFYRGRSWYCLEQYENALKDCNKVLGMAYISSPYYKEAMELKDLALEKLKEQRLTPTATVPTKTPGFEAVFVSGGLLAVAYLLKRRG